jgi:hypothetical protein
MYVNIQSINQHIHSIRHVLAEDPTTAPLVMALSEAQTLENDTCNMKIIDYNEISLPSPQTEQHRKGGGTICYFHRSVQWRYLADYSLARIAPLSDDNEYGRTSSIHFFELKLPDVSSIMLLAVCYLSPSTNKHTSAIQSINSSIDLVVDQYPHLPTILVGDFNQRSSVWDQQVTSVMATSTQYKHASLLYNHVTENCGLELLNIKCAETRYVPTRPQSNSVLDLVFADKQSQQLIRSIAIGEAIFADHLPITIYFHNQQDAHPRHLPQILSWDINNPNLQWQSRLPIELESQITVNQSLKQAIESLQQHPVDQPSAQQIIQNTWDLLADALNTAMMAVIGQVSKRKHHYYWYDDNVQAAQQAVSKARKRWRKASHQMMKSQLLVVYRAAQSTFKKAAAAARIKSMEQLYSSIMPSHQSPVIWSNIARLRSNKAAHAMGSVPDRNGNLPTSPVESLNNLCKQFVTFTQPTRQLDQERLRELGEYVNDRSSTDASNMMSHESNDWKWTADDVRNQCLYQRNSKSAAGPDEVPPVVLKHLCNDYYSMIADTFNYSWQYSVLPSQWTSANVFALIKDHDKPLSDANNYRPISVTSIWIRTFEHMIHRKMTPLIDPKDGPSILYDHQYGFRHGRSCQNAIHLVVSSIKDEQRLSQSAGTCLPFPVIFIDMLKAFDRVCHLCLLYDLEYEFKIVGRLWKWIHRWLSVNRRIRCVSNGVKSIWRNLIGYGVPQGAVLSPILFLLFINKIALFIQRSCPLIVTPLFADDLAMLPKTAKEFRHWWYSHGARDERALIEQKYQRIVKHHSNMRKNTPALLLYRDIAIARQMQLALSLFTCWLADTGMQANASKSKIVVFSAGRLSSQTWNDQSTDSYAHWFQCLKLDGFTLQLQQNYEYLGVTCDSHLTWQDHINKITKRAGNVSRLLVRLFSHQNHMPHPLAAVKLVRALLLPVITYSIEQWFDYTPSKSSSRDPIDVLHTLILKPIRAAMNLPQTTHRLGLLVDCGIPTLHDIADQYLLRYYTKYANPITHADPNVQHAVDNKLLFNCELIPSVHPSVTRIILDAHYANSIKPNTITKQAKWMSLGAKAHFVTIPAVERLMSHYAIIAPFNMSPLIRDFQCRASPLPQLNIAPSLFPIQITLIGQLSTFYQWQQQFKSNAPLHARATVAPLTTVKQSPGIAPILHCIENKQAIRLLMRLRHGRAFTHDIRARFPSNSIAVQSSQLNPPPLNAYCKHPPCESACIDDSAQHLLTECPRHDQLRDVLLSKWKSHPYGRTLISTASLRLHMLLGEPPGTYDRKWKNKFIKWYEPLSDFIISVNNNLPTGEQYPVPL